MTKNNKVKQVTINGSDYRLDFSKSPATVHLIQSVGEIVTWVNVSPTVESIVKGHYQATQAAIGETYLREVSE